jgi:hypothetical protein
MSSEQTNIEGFLAERPVLAAAFTPLSVVAGVVVGGVLAGMSLTDILICASVAGGGVALFCGLQRALVALSSKRAANGMLGVRHTSRRSKGQAYIGLPSRTRSSRRGSPSSSADHSYRH